MCSYLNINSNQLIRLIIVSSLLEIAKEAIGKKLDPKFAPPHAGSSNTISLGQPNEDGAKKEGWKRK